MKNLAFILILFLTKSMSCRQAPVIFEEPQPKHLAAKSYFEPIYRGVFFCDSDSSMVHVHAKTIFKEKRYAFKLSLDEIAEDSSIVYDRGLIFIKNQPEPIEATLSGDTVRSEVFLKDTLFNISENHVLKYFRGHHILNKKISPRNWEVEVISLVGNLDLRYSKADLPEDLEHLEKITPIKKSGDEVHLKIILAPTVLEFSEILKQELIFKECDYFTRQEMPTSL